MTIYDLIDDETRKLLNAVHRPKQQNNRKSVKYTERELLELMGVKRDTYRKVNGKVKRK